ncbi:hypothetical protein BC936DRAFT_139443, partial [Jimgerdemannia flammicorona]
SRRAALRRAQDRHSNTYPLVRWYLQANLPAIFSKMSDNYVFQARPDISPFFTDVHWREWTCVKFLNFVQSERRIHLREKSALHHRYRDCLILIRSTNPPSDVVDYINYLIEFHLKNNQKELKIFWNAIKFPNDRESTIPDANDYILSTGLNVTDVIREKDVIVDLSSKNPICGTTEEWEEIQQDFQLTLDVLCRDIPSNYEKAVDFLCKDVNDSRKMHQNLGTGYSFMFQEIDVQDDDSNDSRGLVGLHIAAQNTMHTYLEGNVISTELSEATFVIRFFSPIFEKIMMGLSDKLLWKWGENTLNAFAAKRNSEIEDGDRVQMGQRTDGIALLYANQLEIMLIEFAAPGEQLYGSKACADKLKMMQGMKDALDRLLLTSLKGSDHQELQKVFVIGVQIGWGQVGQKQPHNLGATADQRAEHGAERERRPDDGGRSSSGKISAMMMNVRPNRPAPVPMANIRCKVMVYIINLAYNSVYRFQEIDTFTFPLNERDMQFKFKALLEGFLRLRIVSSII